MTAIAKIFKDSQLIETHYFYSEQHGGMDEAYSSALRWVEETIKYIKTIEGHLKELGGESETKPDEEI